MNTLEKKILKELLDMVKVDHPEFQEENTTGNDLIMKAESLLRWNELFEKFISMIWNKDHERIVRSYEPHILQAYEYLKDGSITLMFQDGLALDSIEEFEHERITWCYEWMNPTITIYPNSHA